MTQVAVVCAPLRMANCRVAWLRRRIRRSFGQNERERTKQAVDSAIQADSKETGATYWENAALREAAFGNSGEAKQAAAEGLKLYPASQGVQVEAALAYAMTGDTARAQSLAQDLKQRYSLNTQAQSLWLPAIQGQVALTRKAPAEAVENLQCASPPIEYGQIYFINQISCLYPTYIRGQAYLAAGQGKEAAAEFQKILDHSGMVWNCWTGALARLGVARANALASTNLTGRCRRRCATPRSAAPRPFAPSGRMLIRTFPSTSRQKRSTRSCSRAAGSIGLIEQRHASTGHGEVKYTSGAPSKNQVRSPTKSRLPVISAEALINK